MAESTSSVGLTCLEALPVNYDGIVYKTAINAFQAQKAPEDERKAFSNVDVRTATSMGRQCNIDVESWNDNRITLMTSILREQALQHPEFMTRILKYGARDDITHDAMAHDPFWSNELPDVWRNLNESFTRKSKKRRVCKKEDEEGEREEGERAL